LSEEVISVNDVKVFSVERKGSLLLRVRVEPRASRPGIVGRHGDAIKVRLAAPPVEGKANAELLRILSKILGVSGTELSIASGLVSRSKSVRIQGLAPKELEERLRVALD